MSKRTPFEEQIERWKAVGAIITIDELRSMETGSDTSIWTVHKLCGNDVHTSLKGAESNGYCRSCSYVKSGQSNRVPKKVQVLRWAAKGYSVSPKDITTVNTKIQALHLACNTVVLVSLAGVEGRKNGTHGLRCPNCGPGSGWSIGESWMGFVAKFVNSSVKTQVRGVFEKHPSLELDAYSLDILKACEWNGKGHNSQYDKDKQKFCNEFGINLLTIEDYKDKWRSRLWEIAEEVAKHFDGIKGLNKLDKLRKLSEEELEKEFRIFRESTYGLAAKTKLEDKLCEELQRCLDLGLPRPTQDTYIGRAINVRINPNNSSVYCAKLKQINTLFPNFKKTPVGRRQAAVIANGFIPFKDETGLVFYTINECVEIHKMNRDTVSKVLNGNTRRLRSGHILTCLKGDELKRALAKIDDETPFYV